MPKYERQIRPLLTRLNTDSERGMIAARLANIDKHSFKGNQSVTANLQEPTRAEAAKLLNVSERTVNSAKKVEQNAIRVSRRKFYAVKILTKPA